MDCFGPIMISNGRRTEKRWGLIFTCLTTRAVEVEILACMSGPECRDALRRFSNRFKTPRIIRCDNGTNFIWAAKEFCGRDGQRPIFKFNPPLASHMGGAWERLIRMIKISLERMGLPERTTETILRTLLSDIVEWINERPLVDVPLRHEEAPALTPNHFLKPCLHDSDQISIDPEHLWDRFGENKELLQEWWKIWSQVYLPTLAHRPTKGEKVEPINVGDLVFFQHENGFSRGKVTEIFVDPETDQVRETIVATSKRKYRRAATQVAKIRIIATPSPESDAGSTAPEKKDAPEISSPKDGEDLPTGTATTDDLRRTTNERSMDMDRVSGTEDDEDDTQRPRESKRQSRRSTAGYTSNNRRSGDHPRIEASTESERTMDVGGTRETENEDEDTKRPRGSKRQARRLTAGHTPNNPRRGVLPQNEAPTGPITRSRQKI